MVQVVVEDGAEGGVALPGVLLLDAHQDGLGGVRGEEVPAGDEDVPEHQVLEEGRVVDGEGAARDPAADVEEADS